jgi:AraC-like DNA-binding protein
MYWMILELPDHPLNFMGLPRGQAEAYWEGLRSFPHRHCSAGSGLQPILDRVFRTAVSPKTPLQRARMHLCILEYLLEVIALAQRDPVRALSPSMAAVVDHIEQHLEEPLPVERLARESGLSVSRFKSRFRAESGFPPAEFVLRRRIERASRLLSSNCGTVLEVALQSGFASSQYFASAFRRVTGMTPTAFREKVQRPK